MKKTAIALLIFLVVGFVAGFVLGYKYVRSRDAKQALGYFVTGKTFFDNKEYPAAAEALNRSIGLDPGRDSAHIMLSSAYKYMGLDELANKELAAGGLGEKK
jgi:lipoprotein NlpI